MDKKEARKLSGETAYRNVMTNIMADMLTRRAMEHLRGIASGLQADAQALVEAKADDESIDESPSTLTEHLVESETAARVEEASETHNQLLKVNK
jgi:hypothetical protein